MIAIKTIIVIHNGNNCYEIPQGTDNTFFAGSYNFTVKEIEVYSVIKQ